MFESLMTVAAGGLTGFLGMGFTKIMDFVDKKVAHKRELELRDKDLAIAKEEGATAARVTSLETDAKMFEASFRDATKRWSKPGDSGWIIAVDVVRGLIRPTLSVFFVVLTSLIYFNLTEDDQVLREQIIDTVLYITITVVLWWFGTRSQGNKR